MRPSNTFSNAKPRWLQQPNVLLKQNFALSPSNLDPPSGRFYIRCFVTAFKMKHPCLNWYFLKAGQRPLLETALRSPNQDKNNWVYYAMKLNVLMKIKPLEHIPLTISCWATKGSGKRREEYDYLASMYSVLAGLFVSGTDCTTWQRVVSSWRVGYVWVVVVLMDSFALGFWEQWVEERNW